MSHTPPTCPPPRPKPSTLTGEGYTVQCVTGHAGSRVCPVCRVNCGSRDSLANHVRTTHPQAVVITRDRMPDAALWHRGATGRLCKVRNTKGTPANA